MVMFGKKSQESPEPRVSGVPREQPSRPEAAPVSNPVEQKITPIHKGSETVKPEIPNQKRNTSVGTVIGDDTTIEGKMYSKGTLRIDGTVKGELKADDTVIVGPTGQVYASMEAKIITISGKVHGNITATERLELQPTCEILGDIQTAEGSLVIENGARLEGKCTMGLGQGRQQGAAAVQGSAPRSEPAGPQKVVSS